MTCSACGAENRAGRKFCSNCGAALALACPSCGAANEPSDRFCGECGATLDETSRPPVAAEAERRLVSVLFGDLVGFTPLSEDRDPEEVRELLSRYFETSRQVIDRYGGTVEKFIGDAVMAVWGTPVAREDDAERAVRAGLELVEVVGALGGQVGAPELAMRVGIVTGEAAVTIGAEGEGMVAGDLVNFTSLSEKRDHEEVRELLSRYFEECSRIVARYGGTVEKFIGDAVMAVWGVPVSQEDDAERAVRAGLELVTAVGQFGADVGAPDLAMRVGVVTGEVAVTVGATQQGMVAGDPVNTASRVQAVAEPGQVWVDESTRLLTAAAISYTDVGSHPLKGKADPVPLWSVRAVVASVGGAQRADGLEAPLVGRDREMRLIKELFHRSSERHEPILLVLEGEPGVGKSRLSWEFEKYVDGLTQGVRWHNGRCVKYGEGVAYFALAEAIRGRLGVLAGDDPEAADDVDALLDRGVRTFVADEEECAWIRPRIGALLGIGSVGSYQREDLFSAWTAFLERIAGDDPLTLVIDDAQYADDGLLMFIEHLIGGAGFSCFVLLLTRTGLLEARPALVTRPQANVVHVPALTDADISQMLDGLVAGLPVGIREQLVERTDGLPLFAVETVRALIDRDLVVPRGGQYVLADDEALDLGSIAAPASLHALIAARLDGLSDQQRLVVDRASVLGMSFEPESLEWLCPDITELRAILDDLVRLQIFARETRQLSAERGHYRFVQAVVHQVAYGTLSRRDRRSIHLAVVAHLEDPANEGYDGDDTASIRAQHYLDALAAMPDSEDAPRLRASALDNLRRAAARARALGSPREAVRHLDTAVTIVDDPATRGQVLCELGRAELDAGEYDSAGEHGTEAETLMISVGDRVGAGYAVGLQAVQLLHGSHPVTDQALELVAPWWEELHDRDDAAETLKLLSEARLAAQTRLGHDRRDTLEAKVRLAERTGDQSELAYCYTAYAIDFAERGVMSLHGILLAAGADLARRHHDLPSLAQALSNLAALEASQDAEAAVRYGTEGVQVASRTGLPWKLKYTRENLNLGLWVSGAWTALDEPVPGQAPLPEERDGLHDALRGLRAWACDTAWEPRTEWPETDELLSQAWNNFQACVAARVAGDPDQALTLGRRAAQKFHVVAGVWDDLAHVWMPVFELAFAANDPDTIHLLLEMCEKEATRLPTGLRAQWAHARGLLAVRDGRDDEVEPAFTEALGEYTAWGAVPFRARAQADLGRWLFGQGRTDEARPLLDEAAATFEQLGARRWLAELQAGVPVP